MSNTETIELSSPITINGEEIKEITMREPTVGDQLAAAKTATSVPEQELHVIASLCDISPQDLHAMAWKDYRKLQEALVVFSE